MICKHKLAFPTRWILIEILRIFHCHCGYVDRGGGGWGGGQTEPDLIDETVVVPFELNGIMLQFLEKSPQKRLLICEY